jgi:predicted aminopeptidase
MRKTGFTTLGHTNHPRLSFLLKMKTNEIQLIAHDLGCQNIIGQNKGWQR